MILHGYTLASGLDTGLDPELVREVASVLRWYGCDLAPFEDDAAARALLQARAWELRRAADEAAHRKRYDAAMRETVRLLDLAEARKKAREYVSADGDPVRAGRAMQVQGTRHS